MQRAWGCNRACVLALPACLPVPRQGFILGQYGLLYALEHPDQVSRLMVLNTPLALSTKLRPELAPYKAPLAVMRPGPSVSRAGRAGCCHWCRCTKLPTLLAGLNLAVPPSPKAASCACAHRLPPRARGACA